MRAYVGPRPRIEWVPDRQLTLAEIDALTRDFTAAMRADPTIMVEIAEAAAFHRKYGRFKNYRR